MEVSKLEFAELTAALQQLNEIEQFLKAFLQDHPEYRTALIGSTGAYEADYDSLIAQLRIRWKRFFPETPFFLENSLYNLKEGFFIPEGENVRIIKNLRYMPMILHSHQFIEVNYVVRSGGSRIVYENGTIPLQNGDIVLNPPGFSHCFSAFGDDCIIVDILMRVSTFDTTFFTLLTHDSYLSALFSNALYRPAKGCILWHCNGDIALQNIMLLTCQESMAAEKYRDKMLELYITQFFLTLMRRHENEAVFSIPMISDSDEQFRTLLNYMQTHLQDITLTKLAMQYNYSERHILRLLKKHSGKSFSELLTEIRMNRAVQLLKNPAIPISRIASQLGYASKGYFVKVFRSTYGVDPDTDRGTDPAAEGTADQPG